MARFPIHPKAPHRITKEERAEPEKPGAKPQHQSQSKSQSRSQSKSEREPLNLGICRYLKAQDATAAEISAHLEQKRVSGQLKIVLKEMIVRGLIEYSIPDKPRSRLQAKWVIDAVPKRHPFEMRYDRIENVDWESCSRVLDSASQLEALREGW